MACNVTSKQETENIFIPQENSAFLLSTCKKEIRCDDAFKSMTSLKKYTKQLSLKNMEGTKEQYRFYIFTRLKLGDKPKKIHDDLQAVYGANCVPYSTMYKWIQAFQAEESSIKPGMGPARPFPARNEQNIAFVERLAAEDSHSTIRELSEVPGVSVGTIHSILHEDLHMRKLAARWVPHLLSEDQKKRRVECSRQLLNDFEPNGPKRLCDIVTGDETWLWFYGIPNKRCNRAWVGPDGDRPVVLRQGFQSRKRLFSIFLMHKELWQSIFCLRRQQSMQHTTQELCCPKLSRKCAISAQPLAPQEPCFCMTMQLPTKPRSPRPSYLIEESRFRTTTPTVQTLHHATSGFFLS